MKQGDKIFVAGHKGMVGSAILRNLTQAGFRNLITRTKAELDLTNQTATRSFFEAEKPDYVFLVAAKVGGMFANNTFRADFIYENLMIGANVIQAAFTAGTTKLLYPGSSCIYPRLATQPITEESLLTGALEPTNEPYAIAKIAGIKLIESFNRQYGSNFISVMPTNLYGPNDNYHPENSHVLPALIRKFVTAKQNNDPSVSIRGTGTAIREFLHVDDLARACVFLMGNYSGNEAINIGCGEGISILELAKLIQKIVGYEGTIQLDTTFGDGAPKKVLNIDKIKRLGWAPSISLETGIRQAVTEFLEIFSSELNGVKQ